MSLESIMRRYEGYLRSYPEVKDSSYTLNAIHLLKPVLNYLRKQNLISMLDLGCGYGILTLIVAEYIGVKRVYAMDIDLERLKFFEKVKKASHVECGSITPRYV